MSGRLVVMGSGEVAPTMVATHRAAISAAQTDEVVILDSPFGFQENAPQLTERLVEFFETSLAVTGRVASLRAADADPVTVERFRTILGDAKAVFAGPGSPSYALAVWRDHGVGGLLVDVLARGGSVTLASAAALTAGTHTIPVYEIYKVGAAPHWLAGLDLLSAIGIGAGAVVPHWNNSEGRNHDTSRCYIGERRLAALETELQAGILGIDEHTAASFDIARRTVEVTGKGSLTVRGKRTATVEAGSEIGFDEVAAILGSGPVGAQPASPPARTPDFESALAAGDGDGLIRAMLEVERQIDDTPELRSELRSMIVKLGDTAKDGLLDRRVVVGDFVELLLELRGKARDDHRFDEADLIRDRLMELGVEVRDTPDGSDWLLRETDQNP